MSSVADTAPRRATVTLGTFERYLTVWVALCIVVGIVLGQMLPGPFQVLGRMTMAEVNIPVAILIWLMIVPMLLKVDFGALHRVAEQWRGIAVTVGINWLVKPFSRNVKRVKSVKLVKLFQFIFIISHTTLIHCKFYFIEIP